MTEQTNHDVLRTILASLAKGNLTPMEELDPESRMEQVRFAIKRGLIAADGAFRGAVGAGAGIDLNSYHITPIGKMWLKRLAEEKS